MRIGVISDTHGLLRPEAVAALAGCDHILHAGDVGDDAILNALRNIAPVTAIRGNVDTAGACAALPATEAVELAGKLFYLVHRREDLDLNPRGRHRRCDLRPLAPTGDRLAAGGTVLQPRQRGSKTVSSASDDGNFGMERWPTGSEHPLFTALNDAEVNRRTTKREKSGEDHCLVGVGQDAMS